MSKILFSSLLALSVLYTSVSFALTLPWQSASEEVTQKVTAAVEALTNATIEAGQEAGRVAATTEIAALNTTRQIPTIERGARAVLYAMGRGTVWGFETFLTYPTTIILCSTLVSAAILWKFPTIRTFLYEHTVSKETRNEITRLSNWIQGNPQEQTAQAAHEEQITKQVADLIAAQQQTAQEAHAGIEALQMQLEETAQQAAQAQGAQQATLTEQLTKIQQDYATAQERYCTLLANQQAENQRQMETLTTAQERMSLTMLEAVRKQLTEHENTIRSEQAARQQELSTQVEHFTKLAQELNERVNAIDQRTHKILDTLIAGFNRQLRLTTIPRTSSGPELTMPTSRSMALHSMAPMIQSSNSQSVASSLSWLHKQFPGAHIVHK